VNALLYDGIAVFESAERRVHTCVRVFQHRFKSRVCLIKFLNGELN